MSKRKESNNEAGDSEDILRTYLTEISKIPLLSREEEVRLGRRAREGDVQALDRLVNANLRFVVCVAKKYVASGLPLLDLINEGNIGLIEAARKFDPDKSNRFITYAKWWIQQAIRVAVAAQAGIVRLPTKQRYRLGTIKDAYNQLQLKLDRCPLPGEVAEEVGLPESELETLLRASKEAISIESSEEQAGDALEADLEEGDPYGETKMERALILQSCKECLAEIVEQLPRQEKEVITLRFGLEDGESRSLEQVGRSMGLSRERVRQIELAAKKKIRSFQKARNLAAALN